MDGRSLTPLLSGGPTPTNWRTALLSENPGLNAKPGHKLVRTEDHAYIEWEGSFTEMYDMKADPHQLDGTVSPEEESAAEYLAARLDALKDCEGESCRVAEEAESAP
jgi:hypothetical protein